MSKRSAQVAGLPTPEELEAGEVSDAEEDGAGVGLLESQAEEDNDAEEEMEKKRLARREELEKMKKAIRELLVRHPELAIDTKDTLGERLANLNLRDAQVVYENMILQLARGGDWTGPEKAVMVSISKAQEYVTTVPADRLYLKITEDHELKADFRDMTGGQLHLLPSWVSFPLRLAVKIVDEFIPGLEQRIRHPDFGQAVASAAPHSVPVADGGAPPAADGGTSTAATAPQPNAAATQEQAFNQ